MPNLLFSAGSRDFTLSQGEAYPEVNGTTQRETLVFVSTFAVIPFADLVGVIPLGYGGGSLTARVVWASLAQTTNAVEWSVTFERLAEDGNPTNVDNFGTEQVLSDTVSGTLSDLSYADITFTNSQAESIVAGETFRVRVQRNTDEAGDTMPGDAHLHTFSIFED